MIDKRVRKQLTDLRPLTDAGLALLATGSGIYTYLGVRTLLEGSSLLVILAAIIYSVSVSVGIFVFWKWTLYIVPKTTGVYRGLLAGVTVLVGMAGVVAMSSWLNAAALAGPAALEHHFSRALRSYEDVLDEAQRHVLAAQKLLPEVRADAARFELLREAEIKGEGPTGLSGDGAVTLMLKQVENRLAILGDDIEQSLSDADNARFEAASLLGAMRHVLASKAPISERRHVFSQMAVDMDAALANLLATSPRQMVERTATHLEKEIIRPVLNANIEVAIKQEAALATIQAALAETQFKLSHAAELVGDETKVRPPVYEPLNAITAVFHYADDFVPSWAGAVAIDILPGVILIYCIIAMSLIREEDGEVVPRNRDITLEDIQRAGEAFILIEQLKKTREKTNGRIKAS